ncbi:hypothetical protein [uncultured Ruminococcus sp.]|uniref:hypothetical protein n=1 Tax=uncultured Ruminococcus sp. TaxID=165186 RepID=UPI0025E18A37|nr:hypothetical protein [uncultured Ruminococcus sp.]
METLTAAVFLTALVVLPVLGVRYHRFLRNKKHLRKISQRVKNELLSQSGYGAVTPDVLAMVKGHILKSDLVLAGIMGAMCLLFLFFLNEWQMWQAAVYVMVLFTAATGLHFAYDLFCLRDAPALMKVKAFVFMTHGNKVTFIYYDMQKLEYCAESRNVMFSGRANIRAGNYVNIIVRKRQNGYKVIRVLTF